MNPFARGHRTDTFAMGRECLAVHGLAARHAKLNERLLEDSRKGLYDKDDF